MANCTINEKLQYILETKDLIKAALETQDIEVLESDTFRKYAEYITEIRKVSSVNGKVGDVTITAEELGALTSIPDTYITEDELTTALSDKVSQTALNEAIEGVDVGVKTINNTKGDINIKTINGESILGEGDIQIKSDSEETDPIFDKWKNADNVIAGNGAIYDTDGASEEEIHPSVVIGKDASVWADGIAIGENAYAEMGAVTIGKNITSYGIVSIGSDNEGSGIAIGKNNRGNGISVGENINNSGVAIGKNITENYGGIAIGNNVSNKTDNGIAIGMNAKINEQYPNDTDNGEGIAIGMNAVAYNKDDVVIGSGVMTDFSFKTNINDVIKGDSNKYAYIKDNNGNYTKILDLINNGGGSSEGGSVKVVELTQSEYDKLQIKEEGVIYVITDAAEIAIPTKLSELENDKGYITEIPSEYVTDTELSPLVLNVTQGVNSVEVEKYNKAKNTIYYKTINGESILGEGNIEIEGGSGGSGSINIKELTQKEYDALTSYDDDTFYVITDADKQYVIKSDLDNYYTKEEGDEHYDYDKRYWNSFQYTSDSENWISLRNGTSLIGGSVIYFKTINGEKTVGKGDISFKTINGESLIGSGNIQIQGGSADLSNYYTKSEIDSLIGNVSSKINEINNLI